MNARIVVAVPREPLVPPVDFVRIELAGEGIERLVRELEATHDRVLIGRFRAVGPAGVAVTKAPRLDLVEGGSFRTLLSSWAFRTAFNDLGAPAAGLDPRRAGIARSWVGTLTLGGELAHTLVLGGAYARFPGSAAEAKAVGEGAVAELAEGRHEDFEVWETNGSWAPWFYDVAWDRTWFIVDSSEGDVTVLCVTDTD